MVETDQLDEYILEHIDEEGEYLHRLYRATHTQLLRPRMASGHQQGACGIPDGTGGNG